MVLLAIGAPCIAPRDLPEWAPEPCRLEAADPPRSGDCNGDQRLDVGDAVFLLRYLFMGNVVAVISDGCDITIDGKFDITDVVTLLTNLLIGREPPSLYSVLLEWEPVSRDQGGRAENVAAYRVYYLKGNTRSFAAEVRECACAYLNGLKAGVEYLVAVTAIDHTGNESSLSEPIRFLR